MITTLIITLIAAIIGAVYVQVKWIKLRND